MTHIASAANRANTSDVARNQGVSARTLSWLTIRNARHHNLKGIDVDFPLARFVCVTGVSGSGKSSLVNDILREQLTATLNAAQNVHPGAHDAIDGIEHLDKVIDIDQSPIGRTPRSNPATYIKLFDEIRDLFAKMPESKVRGYAPGRFSFNVPTGESGGGRCEACEGNGANRVEMDFLADIWVACPVCEGRRFSHETLQVHFKGKSIHDVLEMDVQQALLHFESIPKIRTMLQTLHDVGLDYLKLGQSSTTLSGGEAQRIKLAKELVRPGTGRTLYILDEPTTGLHFEDIRRLLEVLHGFVNAGNTVVCIEHNLDVIKTADWVIDLGPEGGDAGGRIVAAGTPEDVAKCQKSHTGQALRDVLSARPQRIADCGLRIADSKKRTKHPQQPEIRNSKSEILVVGAREHNLKDIAVAVPRGKMTSCTGVSGSGKSSFAIDTVYTEGQRRYVESLSAYARQFLGQLQKPKVDHVHGLSPAIAIEQKSASKTPRSTVGTVTEIFDYMRVLWARVGQPYCAKCNIPIGTQTSEEIVDRILALPEGSRLMLCAPLERGPNEDWNAVLERCRAGGYARVRIDGAVVELTDKINIDARQRHDVELIVDRIVVKKSARGRIADSIEQALAAGNGVMSAVPLDNDAADAPRRSEGADALRFSQHLSCQTCGTGYDELTPHHFSFNARLGWCARCTGLGVQRGTSTESVAIHPERSILDGAIAGWTDVSQRPLLKAILVALAKTIGFDVRTPYRDLTDPQRHALFFGLGERWIMVDSSQAPGLRIQWKGFYPAIDEATRMSWQYRLRLEAIATEVPCQFCRGGRIREEAAAARLGDRTIVDVCNMALSDAAEFFDSLRLDARRKRIAADLLHEIKARLRFLLDVGLEYLTLHRPAPTLSGGESQRIRLASQIGSGLTGVLYVLDEPTIGLHPRDNRRLIAALHRLRDLGNTLLLVEHDREVISASDHLVDFGPGAGRDGGQVVAEGAPTDVARNKESLTGRYLGGQTGIVVPTNRRAVVIADEVETNGAMKITRGEPFEDEDAPRKKKASRNKRPAGSASPARSPHLTVVGATQNNLKKTTVSIPAGRFTCVTGVSGSGKSSLVTEIIYPALAARIHRSRVTIGAHEAIHGIEHFDKVIDVDQQPIGNSPLSNPATYTGVFDLVRELFAALPESRVRGYTANRFSFSRAGGRCDACEGNGQVKHEMHFLPDVWVPCEACGGARYNKETLEAKFRGKSIADVLDLTISAALELFDRVPKIRRMLQTLDDVGLGYLQLGQPAPTLSGGEAQRVKLAAELGRPNTGRTIYILDEPTTGLHLDDLRKLLDVLHRLVDLGNTVVCIEHNLDVIKTADWVIDLGPEAGDAGGQVVVAGTPEQVAECRESHTGRLLRGVLAAGPREERPVFDPQRAAEKALEVAPGPADVAGVQMPWERDGRRWHTRDRVSRDGKKIEWEGQALEYVVDAIEKLGEDHLHPTDWRDRVRVEIRGKTPRGIAASALPWFFHALTGGRWLLDVSLRVPRRTFSREQLAQSVPLKTLDERDDIPAYGSQSRAQLRRASADWDNIRLLIHDEKEIRTKAFGEFLAKAVRAYLGCIDRLGDDVAKAAPWKIDGRAWHLSQKSIHPRHKKQWMPLTLVELIGRLTKLAPGSKVDWSRKIFVVLTAADGRRLVTIATNHGEGLEIVLHTARGAFTPAMVEDIGLRPECGILGDGGMVRFWIQTIDQVGAETLARILKS